MPEIKLTPLEKLEHLATCYCLLEMQYMLEPEEARAILAAVERWQAIEEAAKALSVELQNGSPFEQDHDDEVSLVGKLEVALREKPDA